MVASQKFTASPSFDGDAVNFVITPGNFNQIAMSQCGDD
jgi:hypothetical protein